MVVFFIPPQFFTSTVQKYACQANKLILGVCVFVSAWLFILSVLCGDGLVSCSRCISTVKYLRWATAHSNLEKINRYKL